MLYVLLYHASGYAGVVCHVNLLWLDGVPQQYGYGGTSSPRAPSTAISHATAPSSPLDGVGGTFSWECRVTYQRPWTHHVFRTTVASRRPSKRQRILISLWGLDKPGSEMLLCNLSLAEDRVRSHLKRTCSRPYSNALLLSTALTVQERDELGLAYRARDVCKL